MKWVLLAVFIALIPIIASWMRTNPTHGPKVGILISFLPPVLGPWHLLAAPISWATWPGYAKGTEITIIDAISVAVIIATQGRKAPIRFKGILILYALAITFSIFLAAMPTAAFFYLWQFGRMVLCYVAVVRLCSYPDGPRQLILGLVLNLGFQTFYVVQQHLSGVLQADGTLGHQNTLGLMSNMMVLPALGMLLAKRRGKIWMAALLFNVVITVATASRATMGFGVFAYAAALALSAYYRWSPRKAKLVGIAVVGGLIAAPLAAVQLGHRSGQIAAEETYDERAAFERAAWLMIDDHPLGVGANQFVLNANTGGYSARAGVAWASGSRAANVHNSYLLALAELGPVGFVGFILLLAIPALHALRSAAKHKKDWRSEILICLVVSFIITGLHLKFEFAGVIYPTQYLIFTCLGLLTGVSNQLMLAYGAGKKKKTHVYRTEPAPMITQPITFTGH